MSLSAENKSEITKEYARGEGDTGSPEEIGRAHV